MTICEVLDVLDGIFTPETKAFSEYVKNTSDDNGFLRTAFCKKQKILGDRCIPSDTTHIIVGSDCVIEEKGLCCRWTDVPFDHIQSIAKLQLYFVNTENIDKVLEINRSLGYPFCYLIDLSTGEVFEKF